MNLFAMSGSMVGDYLPDLQESMGPPWVTGRRCMNCGNVTDPITTQNRLRTGSRYEFRGTAALGR